MRVFDTCSLYINTPRHRTSVPIFTSRCYLSYQSQSIGGHRHQSWQEWAHTKEYRPFPPLWISLYIYVEPSHRRRRLARFIGVLECSDPIALHLMDGADRYRSLLYIHKPMWYRIATGHVRPQYIRRRTREIGIPTCRETKWSQRHRRQAGG